MTAKEKNTDIVKTQDPVGAVDPSNSQPKDPEKPQKPVVDPEVFEEITDRLAKIIADLKIYGLTGHVVVDTTGKVPTACWYMNKKTGTYQIKVGYELMTKLDHDESAVLLDHELLHHVHYRSCDIRNQLMSNVVLDAAINKILYLCNPDAIESLSRKVYDMDKIMQSPVVLACPLLDADQIKQIEDPRLRDAYIDIWGSRETTNDFNQDVPVPLSLYYKLVQFIDVNMPMPSPFGEDSDEEGEESDQPGQASGEGESDQESDSENKSGKGSGKGSGKDKKDKKDEEKDKEGKKKRRRNRCVEFDPEKEDGSGDSDKEEEKDGTGSGDSDKENEQEGEDKESEEKDDSEGDGDEEGDDKNINGGYSEVSEGDDELEEYAKEKINGAKEAGKDASDIDFVLAPLPEFDCQALESVMRDRMFEQTIDEIGELVSGSFHSEVVRQPYMYRPTRMTLTHVACGVTDYMPIYYNYTHGKAKPKIACYVDISGSMSNHMSLVHSLMVRIGEFLPSASFVFHDSVMPIPTGAWNEVIPLGSGTSFDNVLQHACMAPEIKREWFEKWIKGCKVESDEDWHYSPWRDSRLDTVFRNWIEAFGVQGDFVSDDYPVILMITDGEDNIDKKLKDDFIATGKKLLVILLTESVQKSHEFQNFAETIVQINSEAQIICKE